MVQNKPARRGRPRGYDPDQALARARDLFWTQGFAATSLDELSGATKMNRPSLYGAFGDKRAFYRTVLERYREQIREEVRLALAPDLPLREALMRVYAHFLDIYFPADGVPRGCFMISTGVPLAATDPDVRDLLAETFRGFDRMVEKRMAAAVAAGELPAGTDCATLAGLATGVVNTLAIRSRLGESRESLEAFARAAADRICANPAPGAG